MSADDSGLKDLLLKMKTEMSGIASITPPLRLILIDKGEYVVDHKSGVMYCSREAWDRIKEAVPPYTGKEPLAF